MEKPLTILIYALTEPGSAEIRYVGQTCRTLEHRLGQHCTKRAQTHTHCWIKELRAKGLQPGIALLAVAHSQAEADRLEKGFIAHLREEGWNLTNHTDGGQGSRTVFVARIVTPETRAKLSAALRGKPRGPRSAETKAKIAAAHLGRIRSARTRANMSAAQRKRGISKMPKMLHNPLIRSPEGPNPLEGLLTVTQAAKLTGYNVHTIHYYIQRGVLAAWRCGPLFLLPQEEVERWLSSE